MNIRLKDTLWIINDGEYIIFVEAPNLDDYVSVTPEQLLLNRKLIRKDLGVI